MIPANIVKGGPPGLFRCSFSFERSLALLRLAFHQCYNCFGWAAVLPNVLLCYFSQPFGRHTKNESNAPTRYLGAIRRGHNHARPFESISREDCRFARKSFSKRIHNFLNNANFIITFTWVNMCELRPDPAFINWGNIAKVPVLFPCGANLHWTPHSTCAVVIGVLAGSERNAHLHSVRRRIDFPIVKALSKTSDAEQSCEYGGWDCSE